MKKARLRLRQLLLGCLAATAVAQPTPEQVEFFEKRIRPLFVENCYACHSESARPLQAGLRLDTADGVRRGGDRGPAIVAGASDQSLLIRAVRYGEERLRMPPRGRLSDAQIQDLVRWVEMGAPDPRAGVVAATPASARPKIDFVAARGSWAFRPLEPPPLPEVNNRRWPRSPIDRFLLAKLETNGLVPAPPADPATLLRRVYFDLIGLPPSPEEVQAFLVDRSPDAFANVVDKLLASPHYGERWGRHWLDLVRFAETDGHEFDVDKPNAWRYRDYVIRAFNQDLPYDRFVREHIAGDQMPTTRLNPDGTHQEPALGSGFWTLGEVLNAAVDSEKALADRVDNQIDVFGKTFLGLTVSCARCHDHKFDPISTEDYYAIAGFLYSARMRQACIDSPKQAESIRDTLRRIEAIDREMGRSLAAAPPARNFEAAYTVFDDFDRDGFGKWLAAGHAFGDGPVDGVVWSGRYSERLTGILVSPHFVVQQRYIHVRLKGTGLVSLAVDEYKDRGRRVTGGPGWAWKTIDGQFPMGRKAYVEISDLDPKGSVAVDAIVFSDRREPPAQHAPAQDAPVEDAPAVSTSEPAPLEALRMRRREIEESLPESSYGLAMVDDQPVDVRVHIRGDHRNPGALVPRRLLAVLAGENQPPVGDGSDRLALAERITGAGAPLLARVMVNRIWKHHFGRGLVATVDDFGRMGEAPSHPELLDWLAAEFVRSGWSVKAMHRRMLLTSAWRMSGRPPQRAQSIDAGNRLLHHMSVRRLEAETVRDNLLAVAGTLDRTIHGPGVTPYISAYMEGDKRGKPVSGPLDGNLRRSLYIQVRRNYLSPMFLAFDFPQPISAIGRRGSSTVPSQALLLMNNELVHQQAQAWARRLVATVAGEEARIDRMYREAFARPAEASEKAEILAALARLRDAYRTQGEAVSPEKLWADVAHALVNTTEFLFVR